MEDDFSNIKPHLKERHYKQHDLADSTTNNEVDDDSLFIDVKISEGRKQRIVVRSTDSPAKVAKDFVDRHGLDAVSQIELEETLRAQMAISFA